LMPLSCCSCFFFSGYFAYLSLPSFPTRRSSDLGVWPPRGVPGDVPSRRSRARVRGGHGAAAGCACATGRPRRTAHRRRPRTRARSEEHTSELQSRENLVCRLLLEKKKNKRKIQV